MLIYLDNVYNLSLSLMIIINLSGFFCQSKVLIFSSNPFKLPLQNLITVNDYVTIICLPSLKFYYSL